MTDREKLAREFRDIYFGRPDEYISVGKQWYEIADHVLKREIEAIIIEVKYYQKMFSKSKHEYIFTERVNALNRQLKDTEHYYKPINPTVDVCKCVYDSECHGIEMIKSPSGKEFAVGGTHNKDRFKFCPWCGGIIENYLNQKEPTND